MRFSKAQTLCSVSALALLTGACGSHGQTPENTNQANAQTLSSVPPGQFDCTGGDWPSFGQNVCNTRSTKKPANLNPATAPKLAVKWKFQAGGDISATPAVVGSELYVPDWGGFMNKVDTTSGTAVWSISVGALVGAPGDAGTGPSDSPAAIVARDTPVVTDSSVIFGVVRGPSVGAGAAAYMIAVDRGTGALKWKTLVDPHIAAVITSSPVYDNGRVYVGVSSGEEFTAALPLIANIPYPCCSFRGSVVALDAATGNVIWQTHTIEDSAYFQSDGKTPSGWAGAAVWSSPALDRARNCLYVGTGNNYSAPQGASELPPGDHIESVMALDLDSGAIKWSTQMTMGDVWNLFIFLAEGPTAGGPDWDFGAGPNLFQTTINGKLATVLGAGQKSGMYWLIDPDTGAVLWNTAVGPGGHLGGIHWGTAVDDDRIYVGVNDEAGSSYTLGGSGPQAGQSVTTGSWAALNPANGSILWQVANPAMSAPVGGTSVNGPVSVSNGVLFGGSMDAKGTMFAFDGATGNVLWSFQSGATVYGGPAIANGVLYWGNGYPNSRLLFGTPGGTLYAFAHPAD